MNKQTDGWLIAGMIKLLITLRASMSVSVNLHCILCDFRSNTTLLHSHTVLLLHGSTYKHFQIVRLADRKKALVLNTANQHLWKAASKTHYHYLS